MFWLSSLYTLMFLMAKFFKIWHLNHFFFVLICLVLVLVSFCFYQILACRLPSSFRNCGVSYATVQRINMCSIYGQVCCFCQNEWSCRILPAMFLHDRWQSGQNFRAAREFWGSCKKQRYWGTLFRTSSLNSIPQIWGFILSHT